MCLCVCETVRVLGCVNTAMLMLGELLIARERGFNLQLLLFQRFSFSGFFFLYVLILILICFW